MNMNKLKKTILTFAAATIANMAYAEVDVNNYFTVDDLTMKAGETAQVAVNMINQSNLIAGFQVDLNLVDGFDVEKNSRGKYLFKWAGREDGHQMSSQLQTNGTTIRILGYSLDGYSFAGNDGALFYIPLMASESILPGTYTLKLDLIMMSELDGTAYEPADVEFKVTIEAGGTPTTIGLKEVLEATSTGGKFVISAPLVGRYYDKNSDLLFASTNVNSKEGSHTYKVPGDFLKYENGKPMAEDDFVENDRLADFTQYDWVALKGGFDSSYEGAELLDVAGELTSVSKYPTLTLSATPTADKTSSKVFTQNTYRPLNFVDRDNRKGESGYERDMWLVEPRAGEFAIVKGQFVRGTPESSTIRDTHDNSLKVDLSQATGFFTNASNDGKWFAFSGIVTKDNSGYTLVAVSEPSAATSVETTETDTMVRIDGKTVIFECASEVYNLQGMRIAKAASGDAITLENGAYVATIDGKAIKFVIQ